jgi:hypothetical protein
MRREECEEVNGEWEIFFPFSYIFQHNINTTQPQPYKYFDEKLSSPKRKALLSWSWIFPSFFTHSQQWKMVKSSKIICTCFTLLFCWCCCCRSSTLSYMYIYFHEFSTHKNCNISKSQTQLNSMFDDES